MKKIPKQSTPFKNVLFFYIINMWKILMQWYIYTTLVKDVRGENISMNALNKHDYVNETIFCPLWTKQNLWNKCTIQTLKTVDALKKNNLYVIAIYLH